MPKKIYLVTHYDGFKYRPFTSFLEALSFAIRTRGHVFSYSVDSSVDIFIKTKKGNKK